MDNLFIVTQVLTECLRDLWCHVLPLVTDTWYVAEQGGWTVDSIFNSIYTLFATIPTTKKTLEDVIGDLSDHTDRDSKNEEWNPFRLYFECVNARILSTCPVQMLDLEPGDLSIMGLPRVKRNIFQPRKLKSLRGVEANVDSKLLQQTCKSLAGKTSTQAPLLHLVCIIFLFIFQIIIHML
jgi:hypothetical protein